MKLSGARILTFAFLIFCGFSGVFAQAETLTNKDIISLTKAKLDNSLIVEKIKDSKSSFDISVNGLIELKNSGVDDIVVKAMMERSTRAAGKIVVETNISNDGGGSRTTISAPPAVANFADPKTALLAGKTIAINKSSLNPSRQSLENELLKNKDWKKFNLNIVRYKEGADLRIEIGRVPLSLVTHRYVFRVYDNRSGTVIAAGETTSWGSLSKNMAKEITKKLIQVSAN